jgi:hypothetical protein
VRSLWQGQNPAREFEVPWSIFQGICRMLLRAQKQMVKAQDIQLHTSIEVENVWRPIRLTSNGASGK